MEEHLVPGSPEFLKNLEEAEAVSLYFPLFRKALVVDLRCTREEPPLVKVMPMVRTPEERLRSLRRLRPRFPRPKRLLLIPWWGTVEGMLQAGVFDHLLQRVAGTGHPGAVRACRDALASLRRAERVSLIALIRGENAYTLWARQG